jgi:small subunit ribosomal protein S6
MAILLPELAEDDLKSQVDRISGYISDVNGSVKEILSDSPWGRRRLAYTIRFNGTDYRDGVYIIWHFDLEPSRVGEIERELKLDTRVIRYLIVHDDPKWGPKNGGNQPQGEGAEGTPAPTAAAAPAQPATTTETVTAEEVAEISDSTEAETSEPAPTEAAVETDNAVATTDEAAATTEDVVATADEAVMTEPATAPATAETTEAPVADQTAEAEAEKTEE